ncbi:hypothetical protein Tco_0743420 [Tanacetum coccineum]
MHKEDQQATSGLTSLGVTSEERAYPQLSSGMPTFNLNKIMFSASFIIHSKSASGCDALADSTAEADPGLSAPNDSIPQQQGMDEGTKKTSFNHISVGKEASSIARQVKEEESSRTIKLEDLAKLVSNVQTSFKDLDSPEDDHVIVVDDIDEDEEDEVHTTTNAETKDTSAPKSSSPRSSQIQELTNQVIILQFQKHKPKLEKNKAEAALLKTQPTFPNDLSSKFNELTKEVKGLKKQVYEFEIELPRDLKEIPTKLEDFTKTVTSLTSQVAELKTLQWEFPVEFLSLLVQVASVQAKLKTLDALPSLLCTDGEDEVHTTTEDTPVPKSSSLRSSQIQELTNQVFILQSEKHKLEIEKNKGEAKVDLLKAQSSFPNMGQLNELLESSLQDSITAEEVKGLKQQVHELEIELPEDLKEIPSKLEDFTKTVTSIEITAVIKSRDQSVPSAGQADTMAAEGEKNTNQATISQLFQRRSEKNAKKENLNNQ